MKYATAYQKIDNPELAEEERSLELARIENMIKEDIGAEKILQKQKNIFLAPYAILSI